MGADHVRDFLCPRTAGRRHRSGRRRTPMSLVAARPCQLRWATSSPGVRLGYVGDRVRRLMLAGEHRPQRQERVGFVSALSRSDGVRREALQIEQRDVRQQAWLQREPPIEARNAACRVVRASSGAGDAGRDRPRRESTPKRAGVAQSAPEQPASRACGGGLQPWPCRRRMRGRSRAAPA